MLLAADVIDAAQQIPAGHYIGGSIAVALIWFGKTVRSIGIDLLNRMKFVMGFVTLFAKHLKSINRALDLIDERSMSEPMKKIWKELRPMLTKTEILVDEFLQVPDQSGKFDSALVETLRKVLHEREETEKPQ